MKYYKKSIELFSFVIVCLHIGISQPMHNNTDNHTNSIALNNSLRCNNCLVALSPEKVSLQCTHCAIRQHQMKAHQRESDKLTVCGLTISAMFMIASVIICWGGFVDTTTPIQFKVLATTNALASIGCTYNLGYRYIENDYRADKHKTKAAELKKLIEATKATT